MYHEKSPVRIAILMTVIAALATLPAVADQNKPLKPVAQPLPIAALLDGKTFQGWVKTVESPAKGDIKPIEEVLIFKDGMLISKAFKPQGFQETPYKSKREGAIIFFSCSSIRQTDPAVTLEWEGKVVPQKTSNVSILTATAKLTREGKPYNVYSVEAKLKVADLPTPQ